MEDCDNRDNGAMTQYPEKPEDCFILSRNSLSLGVSARDWLSCQENTLSGGTFKGSVSPRSLIENLEWSN